MARLHSLLAHVRQPNQVSMVLPLRLHGEPNCGTLAAESNHLVPSPARLLAPLLPKSVPSLTCTLMFLPPPLHPCLLQWSCLASSAGAPANFSGQSTSSDMNEGDLWHSCKIHCEAEGSHASLLAILPALPAHLRQSDPVTVVIHLRLHGQTLLLLAGRGCIAQNICLHLCRLHSYLQMCSSQHVLTEIVCALANSLAPFLHTPSCTSQCATHQTWCQKLTWQPLGCSQNDLMRGYG